MAAMKIKTFADRNEQFKWMADNQKALSAQRKSEPKVADAFTFISFAINEKGERISEKGENEIVDVEDKGTLKVRCIINTTNLFDSHYDVHFPSIWKKSLKETNLLLLCYEHEMNYKGILSDDVKAYTKIYTWKELGFPYEGETEALVFDCEIVKANLTDDKKFMYDRYKNGKVYNHSVRMRYMKEYWCLNSDEAYATQYKENWDKYIDLVANKEDAISAGWFYAVTEAKVIEGSAVVKGSNCATPALEYTDNKNQADESLDENKNEPDNSTPKSEAQKQWDDLKKRKKVN